MPLAMMHMAKLRFPLNHSGLGTSPRPGTDRLPAVCQQDWAKGFFHLPFSLTTTLSLCVHPRPLAIRPVSLGRLREVDVKIHPRRTPILLVLHFFFSTTRCRWAFEGSRLFLLRVRPGLLYDAGCRSHALAVAPMLCGTPKPSAMLRFRFRLKKKG